jgi:hypothetical protein
MNNNTKWIIGLVVAGVIILGGSLIAYGVTKYHKDHPDSSYGSSSTGSSNPGSKTTTPGSNSATPAQTTSSCSPVSQAASLEGTSGCIQFTGYAYTSPSSGSMYLDQSLSAPYGFSAYIPAGSSFGSSLLNQYSGQNIDVTGSIVNYNGEPEIVVNSASQITLVQ